MPAVTPPVRGQPAKDRVSHHGWKRKIQQTRTLRHSDLEAQTERLFLHRHDSRDLRLHLAALEVETQAHRLPRRAQFAADNLHNAAEDGFFNVCEFPKRSLLSLAAKQQVDDRRSEGQIQLQHRERAQRFQPHRGDIADLGYPHQEFAERNLLRRYQVDLESAAEPRCKIMRKISGKQVVQQADGAQLLIGDLTGAAEVVGHHARGCQRFFSRSGEWLSPPEIARQFRLA